MTADMIMMLTALEHFSWHGSDYVYAFPTDFTDPDETNGHGLDVYCNYQYTICARIRPTYCKIGHYLVEAKITYTEPQLLGRAPSCDCYWSKVDVEGSVLTSKSWGEFLNFLQQKFVNRDFWERRRSECEQYLLANPPRE